MNKSKKECDCCGTEIPFKKLHKVIKEGKKLYFCKMCYNLNRQKHRNQTIKESGIAPELNNLKNIQERNYKEIKLGRPIGKVGRPKKEKPNKGELKLKSKKQSIALALSLEDKQMLLKKHIREGMSFKEATEKVDEVNEYLKDLGKTLRSKYNSQDADKIFKEEFNKLCYS